MHAYNDALHFGDYVRAVGWAQKFAQANREVMMRNVIEAAKKVIAKPFQTMSRGEAKRRFTLDDHRLATEGVECRKDSRVIDERLDVAERSTKPRREPVDMSG